MAKKASKKAATTVDQWRQRFSSAPDWVLAKIARRCFEGRAERDERQKVIEAYRRAARVMGRVVERVEKLASGSGESLDESKWHPYRQHAAQMRLSLEEYARGVGDSLERADTDIAYALYILKTKHGATWSELADLVRDFDRLSDIARKRDGLSPCTSALSGEFVVARTGLWKSQNSTGKDGRDLFIQVLRQRVNRYRKKRKRSPP